MRKWIVGAMALLIVLAIWLARPGAVQVETAIAERQELVVTVQEQGRTRARLPHEITAPVSGYLLRHEWLEGDRVEAGQTLAQLALVSEDPRTEAGNRAALAAAEARRRVAEASLAEAQTNYEQAQLESERRDRLFLDRLIGQEERDQYRQAVQTAETRVRSANSALAAAKAEEDNARARLMGTGPGESGDAAVTITAPVSGTLQAVYERGDRVVAAGTPLFQLSNGDAIELVVDLLTQEAVRVRPGNEITVTAWGGDQPLRGVVNYVEPQAFTKFSALGVEEQRVNVIGTLLSDEAPLGAEYRIEAAIAVWQDDDVLVVPNSALFRRAGQWHVFAVEDGMAHLRELEIGERSRDLSQVLNGLEAGDEVIVFPSDLIQDGTRVSTNE